MRALTGCPAGGCPASVQGGRSVERESSPQKGPSAAWTGQADRGPNRAMGGLRPARSTTGPSLPWTRVHAQRPPPRGVHGPLTPGPRQGGVLAGGPSARLAAPRLDRAPLSLRTWAPGSAARTTYRPPPAPSLMSPSRRQREAEINSELGLPAPTGPEAAFSPPARPTVFQAEPPAESGASQADGER